VAATRPGRSLREQEKRDSGGRRGAALANRQRAEGRGGVTTVRGIPCPHRNRTQHETL